MFVNFFFRPGLLAYIIDYCVNMIQGTGKTNTLARMLTHVRVYGPDSLYRTGVEVDSNLQYLGDMPVLWLN